MKKSKTNPVDIDPQEIIDDIDKIFDMIKSIENTDFKNLDLKNLKKTAESQTTYLKDKYKDLDTEE